MSSTSPAANELYVFVSYRRDDTAGWTSKLCDALRARFGDAAVFKDSDSIAAGEDFETRIADHLDRSTGIVVIIGKGWRGPARWLGRARIWRTDDWVRRELEHSAVSIPHIFPVLVDGASLPRRRSLPASLAFLPTLKATSLRPDRWDDDVAAFTSELEHVISEPLANTEEIFQRRKDIVLKVKQRRSPFRFMLVVGCTILVCFMMLALIDAVRPSPPSDICLVEESPASDMTLDVGFWNIERFSSSGLGSLGQSPNDLEKRSERIAELLADIDLDACGLLEVDETSVQGLISKLANRDLSYDYVYEEGEAGFNLALIYRRDRIQCKRADSVYTVNHDRLNEIDPASGSRAFPRSPLFVQCNSRRLKSPLLIAVVHFKSMYGGIEETRSRRQHASVVLGEVVSDHPNAVVGGTFHALPKEAIAGFTGLSEVGGLRRLFEPDSDVVTFIGSSNFAGMLDYVWVSEDLRLKEIQGCGAATLALDAGIADFSETVSDHRPVMVSIKHDDSP